MPRPTRIEYEGAFHHVMNRGRAHQTIFHDKAYFEAFLYTIEEASTQFDAIFHAYCLMSNHYHLLVETPKANLSRIMRHINGVYTQRHKLFSFSVIILSPFPISLRCTARRMPRTKLLVLSRNPILAIIVFTSAHVLKLPFSSDGLCVLTSHL